MRTTKGKGFSEKVLILSMNRVCTCSTEMTFRITSGRRRSYGIGSGGMRVHPAQDMAIFWNYFSAFVIHDSKMRDEVEGILIAAMPTANSAKPKLKQAKYPLVVSQMVRRIRKQNANPLLK
jgi:hypothetical protein